jgi:peptidyl-prolyl cis-trans isomerase C
LREFPPPVQPGGLAAIAKGHAMTMLKANRRAEASPASRRMGVGLFAALFIIMAQTPAPAQGTDPVLARVNGVEIHQSDLALAEQDLGNNMPAISAESKRDYLVSYLTDIILGAQAAEKAKIQDGAGFKAHAAFIHKKLLMGQLLQNEGDAAKTDAAMHKVYDEAIKKMGQEVEVHARHILFRVANAKDEKASKTAEAKAKAVIVRLKKGEDFAKLAKELTEDPSGKANGGDLGYFTKDQMVPQFAEAAFKLEKGQISEPVKTAFGWHVIKVEDKRKKAPPTYDKVKSQIEAFVVRRAQSELIEKLRKEAKIEKLYQTAAPKPNAKPIEPAKK